LHHIKLQNKHERRARRLKEIRERERERERKGGREREGAGEVIK